MKEVSGGREATYFQELYSNEKLIAHLQQIARDLGRPPTYSEVDTLAGDGNPNPKTFVHRFGSWANALEQAGLHQVYGEDPSDALERIIAFMDRNGGRVPTTRECTKGNDLPSSPTLAKKFGGFMVAIAQAQDKYYERNPHLVPPTDKPVCLTARMPLAFQE